VPGFEIHDDPLAPLSRRSAPGIIKEGDALPDRAG